MKSVKHEVKDRVVDQVFSQMMRLVDNSVIVRVGIVAAQISDKIGPVRRQIWFEIIDSRGYHEISSI